MKRLIFLFVLIILCINTFGQETEPIRLRAKGFYASNTQTQLALEELSKGDIFEIEEVVYDHKYQPSNQSGIQASYIIKGKRNGKDVSIPINRLYKNIQFEPVEDNLNDFWYAQNIGSLQTILEIKDLYTTRAEMEAEANDYISMLSKYGLIYDDPFLESYLYSIVTKILPTRRADGFPYDLKIILVKDETMNACVYPNGVMLVNTGLLSELHTEDELVAVLAHEIGHFVANHTLINMRKMEKKKARAEFWAGLATVVGAMADVALEDTYYGGTFTASTSVLAYAAAEGYLERIGAKFSRQQEEEADKMAMKVLQYLGYDKNGAASLFQRMVNAYSVEGNWAAYYMGGDHPSLKKRIEYSGTPSDRRDPAFERKISFAVTEAAISKYIRGRFKQADKLVSQNIDNNVGTDDDYLIKALCTLHLYGDSKHNAEAQSLIQKAKKLNPKNVNIVRTEIIAALRNNEKTKASTLLDTYLKELLDEMNQSTNPDSSSYSFLSREAEWARKMSIKVNGL